VVKKHPIAKNEKQESVWPQEEMDVISVQSPSIQTLLNAQIIAIRRPSTSLGSRIPSYSCKVRIGCYSTWGVERLRDFTFL
jgi:hypothetical protein